MTFGRLGAMGTDFGSMGSLSKNSYVGPGDLAPNATAWWGFRAYSKATAGNNAVDVIRASDSTTQTIKTLKNGSLDVATLTTFLAATTGKVSKLYDQTGNGRDLTQATGGNQPVVTLNAVGSKPAMTFDGAATFMVSAASVTIPQPYTLSVVAKTTVDATAVLLGADAGVAAFLGFTPAALVIVNSGGPNFTAASTLNTLHSLIAVLNNATSIIYVDGVSTSGTIGSGNDFFGHFNLGGRATPSAVLTGIITEAGLWPYQLTP